MRRSHSSLAAVSCVLPLFLSCVEDRHLRYADAGDVGDASNSTDGGSPEASNDGAGGSSGAAGHGGASGSSGSAGANGASGSSGSAASGSGGASGSAGSGGASGANGQAGQSGAAGVNSDPDSGVPPTHCGDGVVDEGEACDDTNADAADGCKDCALEAHWRCSGAPSTCTAELDANVIVSGSLLAAFSTLDLLHIRPGVAFNGVSAGETVVAIDRRPGNGMLYGLGYNASQGTVQLYCISSETAFCAPIGSPAKFVADDGTTPVSISGSQFGMDFEPRTDRVRIVNDQGQNFRMHPDTGALIDGNPNASGIQPDPTTNGSAATPDDCAYSWNLPNYTDFSKLYTLDHVSRKLYVQNPPDSGGQTSSVDLPATVDFVWGFDIATEIHALNTTFSEGTGYAVVTTSGTTVRSFAKIDLKSAAVSGVVDLPMDVASLAIQNLNTLPMYAVDLNGPWLWRFDSIRPDNADAVHLGSITSGETLVDIDFRPLTGQLYGLGIDPIANTGTLYMIVPRTGAISLVGSGSQIALVDSLAAPIDFPADASAWSIDFDPFTDRLRVMNSSGLNFRVDPSSGLPVDGNTNTLGPIEPDTSLSGLTTGSGGLAGAAYTNAWGGATATTLYLSDAAGDKLCHSSDPNSGAATGCIAVTIDGQPLNIVTTSELDFAADVRTPSPNTPASGVAYTVVSNGEAARVYSIDLSSGAATDHGRIGSGGPRAVLGLAVGHATVE